MKRSTVIFAVLVVFLALFAMDTTAQPGFYTSINGEGVTRAVNKILPPFIAQIKGASFPDIKDGHHRILNTQLTDIGLESFNMHVSDDGTVVLDITRFHTSVELKYRYKRKLFSVSARVRITLGDANFNLRLKVFNDNGHIGLGIEHVGVNAGEASIKFISGGLKSKFLNAIKSLFKSRIKSTILGTIRDKLSAALRDFAVHFVQTINLRANVGDWGSIDLSLSDPIRYGGNNLVVGFSGDIQGIDNHTPTPVARNGISFNPTDRLFNVGIDTFVFNSGFHTFFHRGRFHHVCTKAEPNGYKGVALQTNEWGKTLPAIKTKFPNKDVRVILNFAEPPVLSSKGGKLNFHATVWSHVHVGSGDDWTEAFVIATTVDASATVALTNNVVIIQLQDITTKLSVAKTAIGNIDFQVAVVQGLIQFTSDIAVTIINQQLLAGIPLPLNGSIVLSDAHFALPENAIVAGTNIDFNF